MKRKKRGYYAVEFIEVTKDPSASSDGEVTERHTQVLERIIRENPAGWLWSHKRWKHKRPAKLNVEAAQAAN